MFKFNFNIESNNNQENDQKYASNESKKEHSATEDKHVEQVITDIISYEDLEKRVKTKLKEIDFKKLYLNENDNEEIQTSALNYIEYVDSYKVKLDNNDKLNNILNTHDLVPNKYEGGLKVWELSIDLARFINRISLLNDLDSFKSNNMNNLSHLKTIKSFLNSFKRIQTDSSTNKLELRILELGCGHALPSLSLIKCIEDNLGNDALQLEIIVYLQDFNEEIIENITFENVNKFIQHRNSKNVKKIFKFIYGDWRVMYEKNLLPNNYFNIILTSETIYNKNNYKHLLNIFKECLIKKNSTSSLVLLAAKTYYFGCGGNLLEFLNMAKSSDYDFNSSKSLVFGHDTNEKMVKFLNENANDDIDESNFESISKEIILMNLSS
jgi:hypothetical protein